MNIVSMVVVGLKFCSFWISVRADDNLVTSVKLVGGAPVTQEFADEMGADAYGANAVDCVQKAKDFSVPK